MWKFWVGASNGGAMDGDHWVPNSKSLPSLAHGRLQNLWLGSTTGWWLQAGETSTFGSFSEPFSDIQKSLGPDPQRIFAITLWWALDDASELVAADWFQHFGGHIIQSPVVVPFPMARLELAGGIVSTPGSWTMSRFIGVSKLYGGWHIFQAELPLFTKGSLLAGYLEFYFAKQRGGLDPLSLNDQEKGTPPLPPLEGNSRHMPGESLHAAAPSQCLVIITIIIINIIIIILLIITIIIRLEIQIFRLRASIGTAKRDIGVCANTDRVFFPRTMRVSDNVYLQMAI